MSVLPQLQQELSAAHARRRRRRPRVGFGFAGASVALAGAVAVAVVVIAVAVVRGRSPERPAGPPAVVYRGVAGDFYAAGGSLYAIPRGQLANGTFQLIRIAPSTGRVAARFDLAPRPIALRAGGSEQPDPLPQHMRLAAGDLWITASDSAQTWLWRLDPHSLKVRSVTSLPGGGSGDYSGTLAVAGGWLWVVNRNTLVRVSLTTGRVAGSRTFSRSVAGLGNSITADALGRSLVMTVAGARSGSRVEVLDPRTGFPTRSSATFNGSTPQVVGLLAAGAWINGLTPTGGPARLDLNTLNATATVGRFPLAAQVFDGVVVVSGRGTARCVDPLTGRTLATLPNLVAAEGSTAYVQRDRDGIHEIHRETLDPRCRAAP